MSDFRGGGESEMTQKNRIKEGKNRIKGGGGQKWLKKIGHHLCTIPKDNNEYRLCYFLLYSCSTLNYVLTYEEGFNWSREVVAIQLLNSPLVHLQYTQLCTYIQLLDSLLILSNKN